MLAFELNDLTLEPRSTEELERTASVAPLLRDELKNEHGFEIVDIDGETQALADKGFGYLFDRPDAATSLGRSAGADWIVVGRLHKASFLFVYLKARVIDTASGRPVGDLTVEIKGPQRRMTQRGVETLAVQIAESVGERR